MDPPNIHPGKKRKQPSIIIDDEITRLRGLLHQWLKPSQLHTPYYRRRMEEIVHDDAHELHDMLQAASIEQIMTREQLALQISFAETRETPGLLVHGSNEVRFLRSLKLFGVEQTRILRNNPTMAGSRTFLIALHQLMDRKRKHARLKNIHEHYTKRKRFGPSCQTYHSRQGVVARASPMKYPFTTGELRVLEANEVLEGHVPFEVYEGFITETVCSKGLAPNLASYVLQQALTLKMLTMGIRPGLLPWDLPELLQITRIQELPYASIAFVPLDFFGTTEAACTHFAVCTFLVADRVYQNVSLEISLLLQTPMYSQQTHTAFLEMVYTPRPCAIDAI